MYLLKSFRKATVVLHILCILLPFRTTHDVAATLETQRGTTTTVEVPGYINFILPNIKTGNRWAANSEEFQDIPIPNSFQMKSPSYQHKLRRLHEEPETGSNKVRYQTKMVLSHYMLSKPLRHPIAGMPDAVVYRDVFPMVSNDNDNNLDQLGKYPNGSPSIIPYAATRSLTNITKFFYYVQHNLHNLHGQDRRENRGKDE